eukprot:TRINITY_DN8672_c0_g1_i5.p1 TRINITY_DN8672_c0_g1~~TRINITY_DN8672_c0_g1_i5.p1  ORF type:complete len:130 (+),score=13.43 TRINITY_DN8672_c0_g1_i5:130-519(+)
MIRRPPRSTQGVSSAASDVYKRQSLYFRNSSPVVSSPLRARKYIISQMPYILSLQSYLSSFISECYIYIYRESDSPVSYTHLRAHETSLHLVCRLLLEKKKKKISQKPKYQQIEAKNIQKINIKTQPQT